MVIKLRLGKSTKTGIGSKRQETSKKSTFKRKNKPINHTSAKQSARAHELYLKLEILLNAQHELYGTTRCEAGFRGWEGPCWVGSPLVVDHVNTRNEKDADGFWNLQILCNHHNMIKGSRRIDFRDESMKQRLKDLEAK